MSILIEVENADIGVEWFHAGHQTFDNMREAADYMMAMEGDERTRARMFVDGTPYADADVDGLVIHGKGEVTLSEFKEHCVGPMLIVCLSVGGGVQWSGEYRDRVLSHRCESMRDRACINDLTRPGDYCLLDSGVLVFMPDNN